jgi:hypothetical protein
METAWLRINMSEQQLYLAVGLPTIVALIGFR